MTVMSMQRDWGFDNVTAMRDAAWIMDISAMISFFAALVAVMNPMGSAAIFLSMTSDSTPAERARTANTAAIACTIALLVTLVAGKYILGFFSISLDGFRAAGGLILLLMALSMLRARPSRMNSVTAERIEGEEKDDPGVFPLAIPLIAGPGALAAVIVYAENAVALSGWAMMSGVILGAGVVVFAALRAAVPMSNLLGVTGMNVLMRVMGLILAAIAVEMMTAGLAGLLPGLAA